MIENINSDLLAYIFAFIIGLSMLIYVILDGYDLGVGILIKGASDPEKDRMIASIGPFWDANETWLVLGIGLLLVAFPKAYGLVLTNLYLPVAIMLTGIILRGVAFDFRAKVKAEKKNRWNNYFFAGSLITAVSQGYMLGSYILGFSSGIATILFSILVGISFAAAYSLIGAGWLIMKCEGELQRKAVIWAKFALIGTVIGICLISFVTPIVSERIFAKWFSFPEIIMLAPIPLITVILVIAMYVFLKFLPFKNDQFCYAPFAITIAIFILCFHGLVYSFYPFIVPERLTIIESTSAKESLLIILAGTLVVLPFLLAYTVLVYKIFHGKAGDLNYD